MKCAFYWICWNVSFFHLAIWLAGHSLSFRYRRTQYILAVLGFFFWNLRMRAFCKWFFFTSCEVWKNSEWLISWMWINFIRTLRNHTYLIRTPIWFGWLIYLRLTPCKFVFFFFHPESVDEKRYDNKIYSH